MEVYEEPKFTKEITGGVLGGLLLLILVTVGLVKVINTTHPDWISFRYASIH